MFEIYLITNQINEKIYVGQTSRGITSRLKQHISDSNSGSDKRLHKAMRKYGSSRFTVSFLDAAPNPQELDTLEMFWIKTLESNSKNKGYNATSGGHGFAGLSEESREKHRKSHSGTRASRYRHDVTKEMVSDLYEQGKSIPEIMEIFKMSKTTALGRLKESGTKARGPKLRTPVHRTPRYREEASDEEVVRLFNEGLSFSKMARKLGVTTGCIQNRLKKLNMFRSTGRWSQNR